MSISVKFTPHTCRIAFNDKYSSFNLAYVSTGVEVAKAAIDDFKKIQRYMLLAKKENATETYAELKEEYLSLKAILHVAGVNLTDIDRIKE